MDNDARNRQDAYRTHERWREFQRNYVNERRDPPRPFDLRNTMTNLRDVTVRAQPQYARFTMRHRDKLHHEYERQPVKARIDWEKCNKTTGEGLTPTIYEQVSDNDEIPDDDQDDTMSRVIDEEDRAPKRQSKNNCVK